MKTKVTIGLLSAAAVALLAFQANADTPQADSSAHATPLEKVVSFDRSFQAIGLAVVDATHLFVSAPRTGGAAGGLSVQAVNTTTGTMTPFPNADWNHFDATKSGAKQWVSVQALWVDSHKNLWVLDKSSNQLDPAIYPQKLVKFDRHGKLLKNYTFSDTLVTTDDLNDVRIDEKNGYAYLTNTGDGGGILVVRLADGKSHMVLRNTESSSQTRGQHLMFGDEIALMKNGEPPVVNTDGIALSPDNQWVYYRALLDHSYWRIPVEALISDATDDEAVKNSVQFLGEYPRSGGIIMDRNHQLYAGDVENHGVIKLEPYKNKYGSMRLTYQTIATDKRLSWPDGFSIAGDYLYIIDSKMNENKFFLNPYPESGPTVVFRQKIL